MQITASKTCSSDHNATLDGLLLVRVGKKISENEQKTKLGHIFLPSCSLSPSSLALDAK